MIVIMISSGHIHWLVCDYNSFLGYWGNNLVIFEGNKDSAVVTYKIT